MDDANEEDTESASDKARVEDAEDATNDASVVDASEDDIENASDGDEAAVEEATNAGPSGEDERIL